MEIIKLIEGDCQGLAAVAGKRDVKFDSQSRN